ncbi:MAG: DinB family protein [Candidatus Rokuibacteriota bacterium]
MDFDAVLTGFAALDEAQLACPWPWRGRPLDVRYALYRALEEAQEAHVCAVAGQHPESRRILALAQRAFGDLRGLLVGLPADMLASAPGPEVWSVREVVAHILLVEQRYAMHTLYAVERSDAEPVRLPDARLPPLAPAADSGAVDAMLARLGAARAQTNRQLGDVAATALTRPTIWAGYDVDVRFRLHRFGSHLAEHTIQCEKTLAALGWRPTEGRRIVRRITAALGEVEGLGSVTEARDVEARLAERFASLDGAV